MSLRTRVSPRVRSGGDGGQSEPEGERLVPSMALLSIRPPAALPDPSSFGPSVGPPGKTDKKLCKAKYNPLSKVTNPKPTKEVLESMQKEIEKAYTREKTAIAQMQQLCTPEGASSPLAAALVEAWQKVQEYAVLPAKTPSCPSPLAFVKDMSISDFFGPDKWNPEHRHFTTKFQNIQTSEDVVSGSDYLDEGRIWSRSQQGRGIMQALSLEGYPSKDRTYALWSTAAKNLNERTYRLLEYLIENTPSEALAAVSQTRSYYQELSQLKCMRLILFAHSFWETSEFGTVNEDELAAKVLARHNKKMPKALLRSIFGKNWHNPENEKYTALLTEETLAAAKGVGWTNWLKGFAVTYIQVYMRSQGVADPSKESYYFDPLFLPTGEEFFKKYGVPLKTEDTASSAHHPENKSSILCSAHSRGGALDLAPVAGSFSFAVQEDRKRRESGWYGRMEDQGSGSYA